MREFFAVVLAGASVVLVVASGAAMGDHDVDKALTFAYFAYSLLGFAILVKPDAPAGQNGGPIDG